MGARWGWGGVPPITSVPAFFVSLDDSSIFRVDTLAAAGGTGTQVYSGNYIDWLEASTNLKIAVMRNSGNTFDYSTDGAVSFTNSFTTTNVIFNKGFSRRLFYDKSNRNIVWTALTNSSFFPTNIYVYFSTDAGVTWTSVTLETGVTNEFNVVVAPRHNGTDCYVIVTRVISSVWSSTVYLVDTSSGVSSQVVATDGTWDTVTYEGWWVGSTRYGFPDTLYMTTLPKKHGGTGVNVYMYSYVWSTGTLTQLTSGIIVHFGKQLVTTLAGTLLWLDWDEQTPKYLHVRTSTDGTTWTDHDLTSHIGSDWGFNCFCAERADGTLFIPLNSSVNGHGIFSTDDGATWQETGDFMTHAYLQDVTGE